MTIDGMLNLRVRWLRVQKPEYIKARCGPGRSALASLGQPASTSAESGTFPRYLIFGTVPSPPCLRDRAISARHEDEAITAICNKRCGQNINCIMNMLPDQADTDYDSSEKKA